MEKVRSILNELNIRYEADIQPGELTIFPQQPGNILSVLRKRLEDEKFFIVFDRKNILTERLKRLLLKIFEEDSLPMQNYSIFISSQLNLNYNYIATVFSEVEGISVEHFIIEQKVKKAKELLQSGEHSIGEIAAKLHYSSIGHFSNQFKKCTGANPSAFRKMLQQGLKATG